MRSKFCVLIFGLKCVEKFVNELDYEPSVNMSLQFSTKRGNFRLKTHNINNFHKGKDFNIKLSLVDRKLNITDKLSRLCCMKTCT